MSECVCIWVLVFESIIRHHYIPPQLNFRSRRLPNWLQMNIMKSNYHLKWIQFLPNANGILALKWPKWHKRNKCNDWNGTYALDILVMPSMDSHQVASHHHHKCDEPMMLNRTIPGRVNVHHCVDCQHLCGLDSHFVSIVAVAEVIAIAQNHSILHSTREDIDRYHFRIEDFVNSRQCDAWFDLEFVTKHSDTDKLIGNHRLYLLVYNTNLQSITKKFHLVICLLYVCFRLVDFTLRMFKNSINFTYSVQVISESPTRITSKWVWIHTETLVATF